MVSNEKLGISKKLTKFTEIIKVEAGKIGLKSTFFADKSTISFSPGKKPMASTSKFDMVISKNLKYITFYNPEQFVVNLNRYILDFIDVLTTDFNYSLISSGIHSSSIPHFDTISGNKAGNIWAILEAKKVMT